VAWPLFFTAGPLLLAGYVSYLCRGRRQPRITGERLRELQLLSELEKHENLNR
jgi:hypothetical protein